MTLKEIIQENPNITDEMFADGIIVLRNDSDGQGDYIAEWNTDEQLPNGLKVGK